MHRSAQALTVQAAALVAALAMAHAAPPEPTVPDALAHDTSRIVSIGGAITEILYALGLERRIVGVDSTSLRPPQALRDKPDVGYMRQLSPKGVLALNPSLILAMEGAGPKETVAALETAGVRFVLVPERFTGDSVLEKIRLVAAAAGVDKRGKCLARTVAADLEALAWLRTDIEHPLRATFLRSFIGGRAEVAGRATAADGIMKLAGAVNAVTEHEGYKALSDEAIVAARPDFVLAMERNSNPLDARTVFAHPGFARTPAAKRHAFAAVDGLYHLGFGPRTALAARDLASTLYPKLVIEKFPSEVDAELGEACRG
jgi:iron complex transport system substrate-binding protein